MKKAILFLSSNFKATVIEKKLPSISSETQQQLYNIVEEWSAFNPLLKDFQTLSANFEYKGEKLSFTLMRTNIKEEKEVHYQLILGENQSTFDFKVNSEIKNAPKSVTEIASREGVNQFLLVNTKMIVTPPEHRGRGYASLLKNLLNGVIQQVADTQNILIISYTNDDSKTGWTSNINESLGYEKTRRGFVAESLRSMGITHIGNRYIGPRLVKVFRPTDTPLSKDEGVLPSPMRLAQ